MKSIRIEQTFFLPTYVLEALQKLKSSQFTAFVVGGCVRDFLLHQPTKDFDIATSATPNQICALFPEALTVGKTFGVIKVPTHTEPPLLEIATFRKDLDYIDYRRPVGVLFSDPEQDALRRDFTINALFYNPEAFEIIDFTTGLEDLNAKCIRAIGNPESRFREDALRLLRAVRFAARFEFFVEPQTLHAIQENSKLIRKISVERIRDELSLMWMGSRADLALKMLFDFHLFTEIFPEWEFHSVDKNQHSEKLIKLFAHFISSHPSRSCLTTWAFLLSQQKIERVEKIVDRFKFSKSDATTIKLIVSQLSQMLLTDQLGEAKIQRLLRENHFQELLKILYVQESIQRTESTLLKFWSQKYETYCKSDLLNYQLLRGEDLIELGLMPSPLFSQILKEIEDLALEKRISTKLEAQEYVIKKYLKSSTSS